MSDSDFIDSYSMFANVFSYMGLPLTRNIDKADVVVMGIPYDMGTTGRAGTRHGPQAMRIASGNLRWEEKRWPWTFNAMEHLNVVDYGDLEFDPSGSTSMIDTVIEHVGSVHAQGKTPLSFGGDHFVTLPLLRAAHQYHGTMALVHFDAHTDTYSNSDGGDPVYDHGTMFYKAVKEGFILPEKSVQIGIRTQNDYDAGVHVIDAPNVHGQTPATTASQIRDIVGDHPVYLTFDIDCLDPAFAPGTGTPVWGGLSSAQAATILRDIRGINMVGGDVVEVSPQYDASGATAVAGAHAAMELMCLYCWNLRAKSLL